MNNLQLRCEIIRICREFNPSGLSVGTSGNVSARTRRGFLITPTGIPYAELNPEDIVELDMEGVPRFGRLIPSSEWRFHRAVYDDRSMVNAIVHIHSPYATAVSCLREAIPAFHYEVALAGGETIPCAAYATFGTEQLAGNVVQALQDRMACLLANHGQIALGDSIAAAMKLAVEVEQLAKIYCIAKQTGDPVLLDDAEMQTNLEKFSRYGDQEN